MSVEEGDITAEYQNDPDRAATAEDRAEPGGAKSLFGEYADVSRLGGVFPIAVVTVYLAVSFATGLWAYTWILFLLVPLAQGVIRD
ncbi:MAG: hypothetical protein FWC55_08745 [Firmicutes bacterium]|nr:hypothetical protein [Bacillota bacterium]